MRKIFKRDNKKGFSLLEIMVSIFVLLVGILGVSNVVLSTILTHTLNKDRLVASYLAQEGVELVRNMRDTNWVISRNFGAGFPSSGWWEIDVKNQKLQRLSGSGRYLKIDPTSGMFQYDFGKETPFKRKIRFIRQGNQYIEVEVVVEWQRLRRNYSVQVSTYLYNWCPKIKVCS